MKNLLIIAILLMILPSCTKEYENRNVTYLVTGLANPFKVTYLDENANPVATTITPTSLSEVWQYQFTGKQGDILYLYSEFTDVGVDVTKFKFRILIDGKVYKDAYGYDKNIGDSIFWVKRSGVIPY